MFVGCVSFFVGTLILASCSAPATADEIATTTAARLAREYLGSEDDDERKELADKLDEYKGDIDNVLRRLRPTEFPEVEPGYHPAEHFTLPELSEEYPDDLLYFTVPESYKPFQPTGLIIFMHGGGNASPRNTPRYFMNLKTEEDDDESSEIGDIFSATGMIAVGPSAPWNEDCSYRWCMEETDDYLAAVIRECETRFNINPDRMFLVGHSMGGFGAYHHIQRTPDRFAAVVVNAGSWTLGFWPTIRGTKLCIIQGIADAEKGERWHYTDVEYGRWTDQLLARYKLNYEYHEHDHGHWVGYGRPYLKEFFAQSNKLRRDHYYPHIVLATPVGFMRSFCFPVEHNRWLTLDETTRGTLTYDRLLDDEDVDFDDWKLEYSREKFRGAGIDARLDDENRVIVQTKNVARFTVWLHPNMIDVERPVTILVDGQTRFTGRVTPSLATALESYERRHDWGLIYPIKVEVDCTADADE